MSRTTTLALFGALALVGLGLVFLLEGTGEQRNGTPAVDGPGAHPPTRAKEAGPSDGPGEATPKPGRYLLLLTDDVGLTGFHGEEIYYLGPAWSGAEFLDRHRVKKIMWPQGVDPNKYPAKKE